MSSYLESKENGVLTPEQISELTQVFETVCLYCVVNYLFRFKCNNFCLNSYTGNCNYVVLPSFK